MDRAAQTNGVVGVPPQALLLSLLSLWVPVLSSSFFPAWTNEDVGILIWLLALVPPFLLSYYKGWKGASLALAGAMAAFAVAQVVVLLAGAPSPPPELLLGAIVVLVTVSLGSGGLSTMYRRSLDQAEQMALTDPATALPNRRHITVHLQRAFAAAERGSALSVVLFDLDRFKRVNDRYGHSVGDEVILGFAKILERETRQMNLSARFGGEEFLTVLDGLDAEGAAEFANRIREIFASTHFPCGRVTVSGGVAVYEEGMASPDVLVAAADQALYRAKRAGRNRVVVAGRKGRSREGTVKVVGDSETDIDVRGNGELVLLIDDDKSVLRVLAKALRKNGYNVLESSDPAEALEVARGLEEPVDLVLTDVVMPGMSGFRLVEMLEDQQETIRALYISGYGRDDVDWAGVPGAVTAFLPKPIPIDVLVATARRTLNATLPAGLEVGEMTPPEPATTNGSGPSSGTLTDHRSYDELRTRVAAQSAKLDDAHAEILQRLARAAEYRDDETGKHAERVGRLAGRLARELGLEDEQVAMLEQAAPLHDLGKIAVPDSVLHKPGALTPTEREIVGRHCEVGAELLSGSRVPLLQAAERIALSHHEHWDGAGYPHGLEGAEIPLSARITAVADVYDSLTHDRAYRAPFTRGEALNFIEARRGRQFDPEIVDALLRLAAAGSLAIDDDPEMVGVRADGRVADVTAGG